MENKEINNRVRGNEIYIANSSKTNPEEFYDYMEKKKILTSNTDLLATVNGQNIVNENEMANILNDYFVSVFTLEDGPTQTPTASTQDEVNFIDNFLSWKMTSCT